MTDAQDFLRSDPVAAALLQHPVSNALPPELVRVLSGAAALRDFDSGEYLWRQGDAVDSIFLIRTGWVGFEVHVPNRGPLRIDAVGPGGVAGPVLPSGRPRLDARALTPVTVISLAGNHVVAQCDRDLELGYLFFKRLIISLSRQLEETRLQMLEYGEMRRF